MYLRTWNKNNTLYASLVESKRENGKVVQKTIAYLGIVKENQLPYLKAAFSKDKPKLVYKDGTIYEGWYNVRNKWFF